MSAFKKLGKNTLLIMIGNTSSKILAFLMLPLYTTWLSVEDFGITDLITIYASLISGVVYCCITDAIFVIPKGHNIDEKCIYFSTGLYFIVSVTIIMSIVFGFIDIAKSYLNISNSFTNHIWGIYLVLISFVYFVYSQQFCRSIDRIDVYSIAGVVVTFSTALYSIVLIPYLGVYGFILATFLSYITACVYSVISVKMYRYFKYDGFKWPYLKKLLAFSVPLIPNATMWWLISSSNRPLLEINCGLASIGILAFVGKFPGALNILLNSFNKSWVISAIDEYGKDDYVDFFNKGMKIYILILIIVSIIISAMSETLVRLLTSNSAYYDAWVYIPLLSIAIVFSCLASLAGAIFSAVKISKYYFYSSVCAAVVAVILNIILIPVFGIWGSVFSNVLSMLTMFLVTVYYSKKFITVSFLNFFIINFCIVGVYVFNLVVCTYDLKHIVNLILLLTFIGYNYQILKESFLFLKLLKTK